MAVLAGLDLGAATTTWLGTALVAVGLAALTCSPPVLLLVARANTDLVPLVLLVVAALLINSGGAAWAALLVALAAGIKLWPIGAVAASCSRERSASHGLRAAG